MRTDKRSDNDFAGNFLPVYFIDGMLSNVKNILLIFFFVNLVWKIDGEIFSSINKLEDLAFNQSIFIGELGNLAKGVNDEYIER